MAIERIKLRKLREAKGLSQRTVADLIPKDASVYSRIEAGTARLTDEVMIRLCEILECHLEDLIDDAVYMPVQHHNTNAYASQVQNFNGNEEFKEIMLRMQAQHDEALEKLTTLFLQAVERLSENKKRKGS